MVLYFQSRVCVAPQILKPFLKIVLLFTIGNMNIKKFQYEKFYDHLTNRIKYTRYYITLSDSKSEEIFQNKSILFKHVHSYSL